MTCVCVFVQMRSVSDGAFGSWSKAINVSALITSQSNLPLVLGLSIPFGIIVAIVLATILFVVCHQLKIRLSLMVGNAPL